jgi:hypothetical protein
MAVIIATAAGGKAGSLGRMSLSLRAPWLDLCSIMPSSILANTACIGCGLKSPAETNFCASIARSCEICGLAVRMAAAWTPRQAAAILPPA